MKAIKNLSQELSKAEIIYNIEWFLYIYDSGFRERQKQKYDYEKSKKFTIEWIDLNDAVPSNFSKNYLVIKNDMIGISDFTDAEKITYWAKMPNKPFAKPSL